MQEIAQLRGKLLNHLEAEYRPGERQLAIELVEARGCAVSDRGFKGDGAEAFLVHPNPDGRNGQNNGFHISQINTEQLALEERLQRMISADSYCEG